MASSSTFCDPCRYRKTNSNASKYCSICRESFCKDCAEVHKASKASRKHCLIDASDDFVGSKFNKELEKVQTCMYHDKTIEFYCHDHKAFLCYMCVIFSDSHSKCTKLVDIIFGGQNLRENRFTDKVSKEMQHAITQSDQAVESVQVALSKSKKSMENMSEQLDVFVDSLQNFVDVIKMQVSQIKTSTTDQYKYHEEKCLDTIKVLERLRDSAETCDKLSKLFSESDSSADLFRSAFVIKNQYKQFVEDFDAVKGDVAVIKVVVEKSNVVENLETCNKPLFRCKTSKVGVQLKPLSVLADFEQTIEHAVSFGSGKTDLQRIADECQTPVDQDSSDSTELSIEQKGNNIATEESKTKDLRDANELTQSNAIDVNTNEKINDTVGNLRERYMAEKSTSYSSDAFEDEEELDRKSLTSNTNNLKNVTKHSAVITSNPQPSLDKQHEKRVICLTYINSFEISPSPKLAPPKIEDIICLFDGRLVVSDSQNARFLILSANGEVLKEHFTPFKPKCLVNISRARFAVSMLKDRRIAFVKVKGLNHKDFTYINARHHTKCVRALGKDKLLVTMTDRDDIWYMDILHVNGTLLHTIDVQGFYDCYFVAIQHLSESDTFRIIYGSDLFSRLKCCDTKGNFVFSYNVSCMANITTDSRGFIYIFRINGEIIVLTPEGEFIKKETFNDLRKPSRSSFNSKNDTLYITTYKSTKIHALSIGP